MVLEIPSFISKILFHSKIDSTIDLLEITKSNSANSERYKAIHSVIEKLERDYTTLSDNGENWNYSTNTLEKPILDMAKRVVDKMIDDFNRKSDTEALYQNLITIIFSPYSFSSSDLHECISADLKELLFQRVNVAFQKQMSNLADKKQQLAFQRIVINRVFDKFRNDLQNCISEGNRLMADNQNCEIEKFLIRSSLLHENLVDTVEREIVRLIFKSKVKERASKD